MAKLEAIIDARPAVRGERQYRTLTTQMSRSSKMATTDMIKMNRGMDTLGRTTGGLSKMIGGLAAGFGGFMAIRGAIRLMAEFEHTMTQVRGITRATDEQFQELVDSAREMGTRTQFTAKQAGEGLLFLARAGFSVQESIEALPHTLNLATAGVIDLGRAADIASNVLRQFNLSTSETERVVDVLINTANSANTNVEQLAEAMKMAGPVAGALGLSVEETAAAIGVMGDAGIQGTLAGTQLRGMFAALLGPTPKATKAIEDMGLKVESLNPQMAGLIPIIEQLSDSHMTAAQAVRIFGRRQAAGALILAASVKRFRELTKANEEARGEAERMAELMRDTLVGQWKQFISSIQEATLQVGDKGLVGGLKNAIKWLTDIVRTVGGMKTGISLQMIDLIFKWKGYWEDMSFAMQKTVVSAKQIWGKFTEYLSDNLVKSSEDIGSGWDIADRTTKEFFGRTLGLMDKLVGVGLVETPLKGWGASLLKIARDTGEVSTTYRSKWTNAIEEVTEKHNEKVELMKSAHEIAIGAVLKEMGKLAGGVDKYTAALAESEKKWEAMSAAIKRTADERQKSELDIAIKRDEGIETVEKILANLEKENNLLGKTAAQIKELNMLRKATAIFTAEVSEAGIRISQNEARLLGQLREEFELRKQSAEVTKEIEAATEAQQVVDDMFANIAMETEMLRMTNEERERYIALKEIEIQLDKAGIVEKEQILSKLDAEMKKLQELTEQYKTFKNIAEGIGDAFGDAFEDIIFGTKSVKDAFKIMAQDIVRIVFKELVTKQIAKMVTNVMMSAFGGMGAFATGAAFSRGRVVPFQQGGIIDQPQYFPLAGGDTGLVGEQGPEAIMPLSRGRGGRLGVRVEEAERQPTVQKVYFNITTQDAESFRRSRGQISADILRSMRRQAQQ